MDKTQNCGHLATYSARSPNYLAAAATEDSETLDESPEIGDGGQNAVDQHSVRASLTTWPTSGKRLSGQQAGLPCRARAAKRSASPHR